MKAKVLKARVQKIIDRRVAATSRHFTSEVMDRHVDALIEVIAPLLNEEKPK